MGISNGPVSTRRKLTLAGIGVAGATGLLGLALATSGVVAVADPSPSPSGSASASEPAPGSKEAREARKEQRQDEFAEALAKELGIDKAKVEAALEKVQADREAKNKAERIAALKTRLDAAVAEGKLTREQADAILKAAESGVLPGGLGGRHFRGPGR
jgi:hypothetical protein